MFLSHLTLGLFCRIGGSANLKPTRQLVFFSELRSLYSLSFFLSFKMDVRGGRDQLMHFSGCFVSPCFFGGGPVRGMSVTRDERDGFDIGRVGKCEIRR